MPVALVESEKTAIICSGLMHQYLWLATGGKSCINDLLLVLQGRKIIAFPDIDGFQDWTAKLAKYPQLGITVSPILQQNATIQGAKVYRVGVTNAADRGLDMYSNWGPAIQIKHLSLDVELAEIIVSSVSSDRVIIVCKEAEKDVIVSLLTQIGWRSHIQSIVTEKHLIDWYEKALRGKYGDLMGDSLLTTLRCEIGEEFPSIDETPDVLVARNYQYDSDPYWIADPALFEEE